MSVVHCILLQTQIYEFKAIHPIWSYEYIILCVYLFVLMLSKNTVTATFRSRGYQF